MKGEPDVQGEIFMLDGWEVCSYATILSQPY